ncbi:MAG: putative glycoside hydrolase, partial [Bacillota bacterium]
GRGLKEENKLKNKINYEKINGENYVINKSKEWLNPCNEEVWDYNIALAKEAFQLGFDEVQFDYIRYPALGDNVLIHSEKDLNKNDIINNFVKNVYKELDPYKNAVSIDIFGLTTSFANGMGIGQDFAKLSKSANIISPMVYPSHYYPGVFELEVPEKKPYETVSKSMKDALFKSKNPDLILRPWLQDFSVNYKYNVKEVIAQIKAVEDLGIKEWLIWNPNSRYNEEALNKLLPSY